MSAPAGLRPSPPARRFEAAQPSLYPAPGVKAGELVSGNKLKSTSVLKRVWGDFVVVQVYDQLNPPVLSSNCTYQSSIYKCCNQAFIVTFRVAFSQLLCLPVGSVHCWSARLSAPQLWWWQWCTAPLLLNVSPNQINYIQNTYGQVWNQSLMNCELVAYKHALPSPPLFDC